MVSSLLSDRKKNHVRKNVGLVGEHLEKKKTRKMNESLDSNSCDFFFDSSSFGIRCHGFLFIFIINSAVDLIWWCKRQSQNTILWMINHEDWAYNFYLNFVCLIEIMKETVDGLQVKRSGHHTHCWFVTGTCVHFPYHRWRWSLPKVWNISIVAWSLKSEQLSSLNQIDSDSRNMWVILFNFMFNFDT